MKPSKVVAQWRKEGYDLKGRRIEPVSTPNFGIQIQPI